MSLSRHHTHVNDIPVTITTYDNGGSRGETDARRLAADLERGAPAVREVENAPMGVDVWIEPPEKDDTELARYPTPDGFAVKHISHFGDGDLCVTYEVDA